MENIKTILVPYNFSEASKKGLQYAIDFTGHRPESHIHLSFISEATNGTTPEQAFEEIKQDLTKAFRAKLTWSLLSPGTVDELLNKSKEDQADIVIMGTSGSGDPKATTHTSEMVLNAECPILVVPEGAEDEFKLSKIALVLGSNEIDDPNLLYDLLTVARTFNARVTVLTIANKPGPFGYSEEEERNERLLEYYLESFYSHHDYIKSEDIVQGIFDYVEQHEIDMIAILPRRHVLKGTPSEGRLTRILTLQSRTPLLAIEH